MEPEDQSSQGDRRPAGSDRAEHPFGPNEVEPRPSGSPPPGPAEAPSSPAAPSRGSRAAPAIIALDRIDGDATFRLREEGDLSLLATDLARLGQLFPVELRLVPPDRFQIVCGFRRIAALKLLQRDKVVARLHTDLSDEDALLLALAAALHSAPVTAPELQGMRERLDQAGRLTPAARDMLDKALAAGEELSPETVEEEQEVDADELAADITVRLGEINQDLSLIADVFGELDPERKDELLTQLRYSAQLVNFLEGK